MLNAHRGLSQRGAGGFTGQTAAQAIESGHVYGGDAHGYTDDPALAEAAE